jgi:MFS family permease
MPPQLVPPHSAQAHDFSELDDAGVSSHHWKIMFISGMGFFTIGVVMSLVKPIWHTGKIEEALVDSTALLASAIGALLFGRVADMLGRKRIYGVEVLVLAAGAIGCALAPNIWWLIGLRFILGIGIGGDYPVSATIMAEYAGKSSRGMLVTLVFAMQAAGLVLGPLLAAGLLATSLSRRHLKETPRSLAAAGMEENEAGELQRAGHFDPEHHSVSFWDGFHRLASENKLLMRLVGASAAWFLMDAAYYGNTVSSPMVLSALNSDHTLLQKMMTQLGVFAIFAVPGYALSAWTMDRLGRKTIQCLGFAMMAVAFLLLAFWPNLQQQTVPFLVIYGFSFFFTEFGPNATTFVYPSEIFPVRVRTTGHGVAAAMGKLGGFLGVFVFPFLLHAGGLRAAESAAAAACVLGLLVTYSLLPETKGKSLEEIEREAIAPAEKLAA